MRIWREDLENVVDFLQVTTVTNFIRDFQSKNNAQFDFAPGEMGVIAKNLLNGHLDRHSRRVAKRPCASRESIHKKSSPTTDVTKWEMREIDAIRHLDEEDIIGYIVDGVSCYKNERWFLSGANN